MILALRLARRELRGGVRGLGIVLLCLALGVAAIAAVGTLRAATDAGLTANGRQILGGDIEIGTGAEQPPVALRAWLQARGAGLSEIVQMRSLLVAPSGERQLVELRAVDHAWPLVGAPVLNPPQPIATALGERNGQYGLAAHPVVLDRLGLHPGDTARLGTETFVVRAVLVSEPDRVASPVILGAPVLIDAAALPATGLVVPGSLVSYALRAIWQSPPPLAGGGRGEGADEYPPTAASIESAFPNQGWRIRGPGDAAPGIGRFIDQTSLFLTLVGLTSLLVGGIGVANGVRAWLVARTRTIATLRCLGAPSALVFAICLIQVMALACAGIVVGLVAGAALPLAAMGWLKDVLPVPPVSGIYPGPLMLAACYGVLTALGFTLWPLGRAARIPGAALFRDALMPEHVRPAQGIIIANVGLVVALVALTVAASPDRRLALWFCAAALATLVVFRLAGLAMMRLARAVRPRRAPWARLGVANLHRPNAPTALMLVSVGLGLATLAAVALTEGNIRREVLRELPADAPSFYFVDIQPEQLARFEALVRSTPGVESTAQVPSLRARIVAVNGVPAEQVKATPDTRWALRGDRGLTYAATPPPDTKLVAGRWWPADYQGKPLVSVDAGLAKGWGLGVGGTVTVNVLGRDVELTVASLRDIAWQRLGLNFVLVASPGLLAQAPHTHIATVRVATPDQGTLLRRVSDALPNVTGIEVGSVLAAIAALVAQLAAALAAAGSVTLIAGVLVLIGAVAAGQQRRTREAVILKTLGATRAQIRAAWLVEFGVLGLAAGIVAALVGTLASWAVLRYVMHTDWTFLPTTLVGTLIAALATMLAFGYAGTAAALRAKAAPWLRNE
jgi:putative ABC transport system permease protein